jgi:hypothetical protein
LFVRDWPKDKLITISGLQNTIDSAYLLIDKSINLKVTRDDNKTNITLPAKAPDNPITVVVLQIDGSLDVDPLKVFSDEKGEIKFNYLTAITHGKTRTRFNRLGGFYISKWTGPEDTVEWFVNIDKPDRLSGEYSARN